MLKSASNQMIQVIITVLKILIGFYTVQDRKGHAICQ